jgi:DNA-binding MarR family transcriptional regulator
VEQSKALVRYDHNRRCTHHQSNESLESKGYVVREKSQSDRRSYRINLTEKGVSIQPIILKTLKEWTDIIKKVMDEEEKDAIIQSS